MKGLGTSPGIGIGKAFIYKEPKIKIEKKDIKSEEAELKRLDDAVITAEKEIDFLHKKALEEIGEDEAEIFTAHKMILDDPEFIGEVRKKVSAEKINVEWAVNQVAEQFITIFDNMEDEYLKARAADLKDVSSRLLRILLGIISPDLSSIDEDSIVIAEDLTPSDTAHMNKEKVVGMITELGGKTSHTSIIARTMGIPAVAGVDKVEDLINHGDIVIIDGDIGRIIENPTEEELEEYNEKLKELEKFKKELQTMIGEKSVSKDGHEVELAGNIGAPADIDEVLKNDGEGVGLFRTEFLYMNNDKLPTEEEQFEAYKEVAEKLGDRPLVIRTLDVGGDKDIPYLELPKEMNPFLGYR